jgi:zeaxanthin glucosyltransferase
MLSDRRRWHFGVLSFTGTGHVNPLIALSQELKARGHRVTFLEKPKIKERVLQAGLEFVPVDERKHPDRETPPHRRPRLWQEIARLRFNLSRVTHDIQRYVDETPSALIDAGVNVLLINEVALTGPTVAQLLQLPYFLISTSVPHHFGWGAPFWSAAGRGSSSAIAWLERQLLELTALRIRGPIRHTLDGFRRRCGFGPVRRIATDYPYLAHITQLPECLDLKRSTSGCDVYYTGPWVSKTPRPSQPFPWDRLDGRPLIYATLGTTRNVDPAILRMIAEACATLEVQLVISVGNRFAPEALGELPGNPVVTRFAPQLELLTIARVVISHGGPNTAFETLMEGKPMIVIPIAYDQPAIAARLMRLHVAEVLSARRLSAERIRNVVSKVLCDTTFREAAQAIKSQLTSGRGAARAADIIELELEGFAVRQRLKALQEWLGTRHEIAPQHGAALSNFQD